MALTLLLAGCGSISSTSSESSSSSSIESSGSSSSGTSSTSQGPVDATSVHLTLSSPTVNKGSSISFTVEVLPSNALNKEYVVSFLIGRVQIEGNDILGLRAGDDTISVSLISNPSLTDTASLEVVDPTSEVLKEHDYLTRLGSSPFIENVTTASSVGSFEGREVGIDKERFENETVVNVPSDATEYLASDYGVSPDGKTNASNLIALLAKAKNVEGVKVIRFVGDTYYFGAAVSASLTNDVYLVGTAGTKFIYTSWVTYLDFRSCNNIFIKDIVFDYDPSPTIVGTIASYTSNASTATVVLDIPSQFDLASSSYASWNTRQSGSYAEYVYDSITDEYYPDSRGNLYYSNGVASSAHGIASMDYSSSTKQLTVVLNQSFAGFKSPALGKRVAIGFSVYEIFGFYFNSCENVHMENVTVYSTAGMGLRNDEGHNMYLNRVRFMRDKASDRLLTCTADIIHTADLTGDLKITNCVLEGSHDDALNIKAYYTRIDSIQGNDITIRQTTNEVTIDYAVGDTIDLFAPDSFALAGTYKVTAAVKSGSAYTLTLDQRPSRSFKDYYVANDTQSTHLSLDNSLIGNKRNRGILLQCRHSEIKNCTFENIIHGGIMIFTNQDGFGEGIAPKDVKVTNNKFINNIGALSVFSYDSAGKSSPTTISDVTIANNFFSRNVSNEINVSGANDVTVTGNLIYSPTKDYSLSLTTVSGCSVIDNCSIFYSSIASGYTFCTQTNTTDCELKNNSYRKENI